MEIQGTIVQILDMQSGEGKNGAWRKQEYILETQDQYPKKVCLEVWGDKISEFALNQGDQITASVNVESREFNGRWYTNVKMWKVEKAGSGAPADNGFDQEVPFSEPTDELISDSTDDDLPF